MSAEGVDTTGQAALAAKLDEIIHKLDVLQATVDRLGAELRRSLSQLSYDLAASQVQDLIKLNSYLNRTFKQLARSTPQTMQAVKREIRQSLSGPLLLGLETWHAALCGLNGKTGMIEAWNRDVYNSCGALFGWDQATAIQQNWDFVDAQQAMTVAYLVEHLNDTGQKELVRSTLEQWRVNRFEQLVRLRGVTNMWDEWPKYDSAGRRVGNWLLRLSFFPKDVIITTKNKIMWHLQIGPEVPQLFHNIDFAHEIDGEMRRRDSMIGCGGNRFSGDVDAEFRRRAPSYKGRITI